MVEEPIQSWLQLQLQHVDEAQLRVLLPALAAAGLFFVFLGYRLFRVTLGLAGFMLAGASAFMLSGWVSGGNVTVITVATLFGGLCGAMALAWLYRTGVFLLGVFGGWTIGAMLLSSNPESWAVWAMVGAAVAGAILAMMLERPIMTLATAVLGSWLTVYAAIFFFKRHGLEETIESAELTAWFPYLVPAVWALLAAAGVVTQFSLRSRSAK
jgi:hypothetical protein